jgi:hypothetical protein
MPTFVVVDPETGEEMRLVLMHRNGRTFLARQAPHIYDMNQRSARQLETNAAFAVAASTAYGTSSTDGTPPTNAAVRELLPKLMKDVGPPVDLAAARQAFYRSLIPPEELALGEWMLRQRVRGIVMPKRTTRRARPTPHVAPRTPDEIGTPPGY